MALLLLVIMVVLGVAEACRETAITRGRHLDEAPLAELTTPDLCSCCAECHRTSTCSSLSFSERQHVCQLHRSVASYSTLQPDDRWQYLIMPYRSGHHQLCSQHNDCLHAQDQCHARVCTALNTVTCDTIFSTFGAGATGLFHGIFYPYGRLANRTITLRCRSDEGYAHYTRVFHKISVEPISPPSSLMLFNWTSPLANRNFYSILQWVDEMLPKPGQSSFYRILIFFRGRRFIFRVPEGTPFLPTGAPPSAGYLQNTDNFKDDVNQATKMLVPPWKISGRAVITISRNSQDKYYWLVNDIDNQKTVAYISIQESSYLDDY